MNTIKQLILLPKIYSEGNMSWYDLLKSMGYLEKNSQIKVDDIYDELVKQPECIDLWRIWSENKRCSPSWYFKKKDNKTYEVGYCTNTDNQIMEFSDKIRACSFYIKKEIDSVVLI